MMPSSTEFIDFIHWYAGLDFLTTETKYNFLKHLQTHGFDERSEAYIDQVITRAEKIQKAELDYIERKQALLKGATQIYKPWEDYFVKQTVASINDYFADYQNDFRDLEFTSIHKEESIDQSKVMDEVEALKARFA